MRLDVIEQAQAIRAAMNTASQHMPDDVAATQPSGFYEAWEAGKHYDYMQIVHRDTNGKKYRVMQPGGVDALKHQPPEATGMTAVYAPIDVTHAGTVEDPIPAERGMVYTYGRYYLDPEDSKTYLCVRGGETGDVTLQFLPHELVGHYFEEVTA